MGWLNKISPRLKLGLALVFLAGLNTAAYWPSLRAPFLFDDYFNILENADVWRVGMGYAPLYKLAWPRWPLRRPLANLSFALNLRCFGPDPFSFHLVNLIIHLLNASMVFFLIRKVIQLRSGKAGAALLPPLAGALFWSLHPLQTQAITYVVQRMTSLAAFFYLLAFFFWISARSRPGWPARLGWMLAALASAGLGFLVKETLVTLPLVIVLWELVLKETDRPFRKRLLALAPAAAVLAAYAVGLLVCLPRLNLDVSDNVSRFYAAWGEKLLSQPRVIWHYLSLLAFPLVSRLNLDPAWTGSASLFVPWTTLPAWLALIGALLSVAVKSGSRPTPLFVLLFFLLVLLPESVIPMDPIFEHRLYLPSVALLGASGAALAWPGSRQRERRVLLAVSLVFLSILTFSRNQLWTNELSLWRDAVKKAPRKARPWVGLAQANLQRNQIQTALQAYQQAAKLDPNDFLTGFNLTLLYLELGDHRQARLVAERMYHLKPENPFALLALGSVAGAGGDADHAVEWYSRLQKKKPVDPNVLNRLACGLLDINRPDRAEEVAEKIFQLFPGRAGNYLLLGNIRFYQGRWSEAANAYAKELELDPHSLSAINNLGMAYVKQGRLELALNWFEQAVAEDPSQAISHENLCETFYDLGRLDRAQASCLTAVRLDPSLYLGWKKLGEIYLREGRREAAVQALEQAKKLAPDDPEVKELWEQAKGGPGGIRP